MNFAALSLWVLAIVAIPAIVIGVICVVALRGTEPRYRPEIIRALADLAAVIPSRPGGKGDRERQRRKAADGSDGNRGRATASNELPGGLGTTRWRDR